MKCQPGSEMEEIYGQWCCKESGTCGLIGNINHDQVKWFHVKI